MALILALAGVLLGRWQNIARNQGRLDPITGLADVLTAGPAGFVRARANAFSDWTAGMFQAERMAAENRRLKQLERIASLYADRQKQQQEEIDALRKLVGLPPVAGQVRVPAELSGLFLLENRATITAGSKQGVQTGMPVISGDGLIGVVQTVTPESAQVLLVSSPVQRVGAVAVREGAQPGIARGETATTMMLEFLDINAPIEVGDLVVTSGLSLRIPKGIPLGRVVQVDSDPDFGTRRARLKSVVLLSSVREVFVLR